MYMSWGYVYEFLWVYVTNVYALVIVFVCLFLCACVTNMYERMSVCECVYV